MIRLASDSGNAAALVFFLFDLLHLDVEDPSGLPIIERRSDSPNRSRTPAHRCATAIIKSGTDGSFMRRPEHGPRNIVSKRADAGAPGNRGCGSRSSACIAKDLSWSSGPIPKVRGPISVGCCSPTMIPRDGWSMPAAPGTGIKLERLWLRLQSLTTNKIPLEVPPPRTSRFGSPLVLSRMHWVWPKLVAEVKYLTWTEDNLLHQSSMKVCVRTSRRPRYAVRHRIGRHNRRLLEPDPKPAYANRRRQRAAFETDSGRLA